MKTIILLFFCWLPTLASANVSFNEMFEVELEQNQELADRVASYHATDIPLALPAQQTELETLQKSIDALLQTTMEDPIYHFINGLNHNNMAALFSAMKQPGAVREQINQRNLAYQKAMLLDNTPPLKLSAAIYATMKHGLPEADKIKAIEKEIKGGGSSDDQNIQLHWSLVYALEKVGRHDEAQRALTEMQREITKRELKNPDYQRIVERAQQEIDQGRRADSKTNAGEKTKTEKPKKQSTESFKIDKDMLWIIFFAALALASIWMIVRAFRGK